MGLDDGQQIYIGEREKLLVEEHLKDIDIVSKQTYISYYVVQVNGALNCLSIKLCKYCPGSPFMHF